MVLHQTKALVEIQGLFNAPNLIKSTFFAKISSIIRQNISMLADEQGLFDVDTLKANLNTALNKAGNVLNVPLINYRIDTKDLNTIFTYLQEQSNENSRGI